MKKFLSLFFMSLACVPLSVVAQTADDEGTEATTYQFEQVETICNPKAYIHVKIEPGATALYSDANAKFTRATLRNASALSYIEDGSEVETQLPYTRFFADYDLANGVITYFVYDNLYIPSKSTIKLTLPVVCAKYADDVVRTYKGETISLTVADAVYLSESCNSSSVTVDKNQTLIIKKSSVLTVDNDLEIANLIVEAGDESSYGAGVIVNNGASLAIADTAYFLCHNKFHRNNPYLINNGSYTAAASIFTKSVDNSLNLDYATKYGYLKDGVLVANDYVTPTISYPVEKPNQIFGFYDNVVFRISQSNIRDYISGAVRYYYHNKSPKLSDEYPFSQKCLQTTLLKDEAVFRANGKINDEEVYEKELVTEYVRTNVGSTVCGLNNPYQACIDWSAIIADQPKLIETLRNVSIGSGRYNIYWSYHLPTGLTTYDGPIQFGYLQPAMEAAHFYSLGLTSGQIGSAVTDVPDEIKVILNKKYLTSYKEIESKGVSISVPYIRFYVDDPDCPKGKGNRSVYVAYFVPEEEYDYEDASYYNPLSKANKLLDVFYAEETNGGANTYGARLVFPYVGSNQYKDLYQSVHVSPLPSKGNQIDLNERFLSIAVDPSQKRVELGILDYGNFKGLKFVYGPLVIDTENPSSNVEKAILSIDAEEIGNEFTIKSGAMNTVAASRIDISDEGQASIVNISYEPSSIKKARESTSNVCVYSKTGEIFVNTDELSHVKVYSLGGVLLTYVQIEGLSSIKVGKGAYIVKTHNKNGESVSKVLVN